MSDALTPLERRVYHYLLDFLAEKTYQPSIREIGRRFRIKSTKTVAELLASLDEKGFIERDHGRSRGVRILGFSSLGHIQPVPLYERLNSSDPHLSPENRVRFIAVDRSFIPTDDAFFLRMAENAMVERGMLVGDLLLVNPRVRARDGDAVVAQVGDRTVVRNLERRGAVVVLGTGLLDGEMQLGPSDDFSIVGVVAGVMRPFREVLDEIDEDQGENGTLPVRASDESTRHPEG